jgi:hypothetical protein
MSRIVVASIALMLACQAHAASAPSKTMTAFASEAQLQDFFKKFAREQEQRSRRGAGAEGTYVTVTGSAVKPAAPAAESAASDSVAESVTNNQTAGVDEGGIVKVHGKHLVMLRRGRLFTVNVDRGQLQPVSMVNAYAPEADPSGTWYDEMLIAGNTVAVVGYSYSRGGTEIGLFDIDDAGRLSYRATYHMRSNDYYSARNYASRQIGSKLIFYTPLAINPWQRDPFLSFPAVRMWRPDATPSEFQRIAPATRIYRTDEAVDYNQALTLHTVTVCDLARREMRCEATAVMGPYGRVFYVSADSVYVWTTPLGRRRRGGPGESGLFRIPLSGAAPSALKVSGAPIDQMSFLESDDGHLNVLVRSDGQGDGMWRSEQGGGDLALLRVALDQFSDGRDSAPRASYRPVPQAGGYGLQNRFVGDWLLYGAADGMRSAVQAVRWDGSGRVNSLTLTHGVQRIEAMGKDAVVVGASGSDLHFTSVALGRSASLAQRYVRANAAQGESRSHGFFYKPEGAERGMVGLPILQGGGERQSASVLYLRNDNLALDELGTLRAGRGRQGDDGCVASCVDWYGNARPLFLRGRVFALMGYELVEGKVSDERIVETRRIDYGPSRNMHTRRDH